MTPVTGRPAVAIVGMACRFPGADTPAAFWENLCRGVESITFFSDDELLAAGVTPALLRDPNYVKAAPILADVDGFDAAFFGYSPREAALMDPQQRLFLEVAWEALEDAGYYPAASDGVVGVFAGGGGVVTSYLVAHRRHPAFPGATAGLAHLGNDKDFLATRVSYKLNLTGPSITVQTACSTSLVAVHLACQSLQQGECDMAVAGAATVRIPQVRGYLVEKGNVHSGDGHCRAFDAAGQGTIFGSGVAAVLLKNLEDARADGDHIYALILGSAVNNDGGAKVSYTAPSVAGQARAMVQALTVAGVPAETIGYVECHATGTAVGDPLEIQALTGAFRTQTTRRRFCAVASVKPNIGHPEQTAGLAGLIKTALSLRHARIPPSLHFVTPNPRIDFEESPFYVNTELRDFPADGHPRRAAVNSLGIGGTNAFAVLEEPPPRDAPSAERPLHLFTLSAKNEPALRDYAGRFEAFLDAHPDVRVADLCHTTNVSRSFLPCRFAVTTAGVGDLREKLGALAAGRAGAAASHRKDRERRVVFLFTGQGSQYPGMAAELYRTEPTFRRVLDECNEALGPQLDRTLLDVLFARDDHADLIHETVYTQPALFAVEYALTELWRAWGVEPGAVMGHSVGELVAACVAGVFELPDALRLVAARGRLMHSLPRLGAMAVAFAREGVVQAALDRHGGRAAIAALNGPHNTVVSGEREAVATVLEDLERQGIASKPLTVSHAFHSPSMDPILDALEEAARAAKARAPRIPLISNVTGTPMEAAPAARYWRDHARQAVRFADGLRALHGLGHELYLEVGPGSALLGMGRQSLPDAGITWLASLGTSGHDWQTLAQSLAALYLEGFSIDWARVHGEARRRRVPLPTYPFQRRRYWLESTEDSETDVTAPAAPAAPAVPGVRARSAPNEIQLDALCGKEQHPYLADHRVHGRLVLPTAAGIDAALAAGRACFGDGDVQIEEFTYHTALVLPEDGSRPIRVVVTPRGEDRAAFRLLGRDGGEGEDWRTHMTAVVSRTAGTSALDDPETRRFSADEARAHCPRQIDGDVFYAAVRDLGLAYGPRFRGVEKLWQGDTTVLASVRLAAPAPPDPVRLHPTFLDACLQVYLALVGGGDQAYLPVGLERFRVYRHPVNGGWAHATLREGAGGHDTRVVDIRIYDDAHLAAVLEGLTVRRVPSGDLGAGGLGPLAEWLYELRWDEQPAPPPWDEGPPAHWLVFADRGGVGDRLAALLEKRGDRCVIAKADARSGRTGPRSWAVDPTRPAEDIHRLVHEVAASAELPCRGVVYLWSLDVPSMAEMTPDRLEAAEALATGGALHVIRALTDGRSSSNPVPRLWFVTRNAQAVESAAAPPVEAMQAPLWGLGRTVAQEYPAIWGGLIDLSPTVRTPDEDADSLAAELQASGREREVALRDRRRFGARLVRLPQTRVGSGRTRFRDDSTYLITGGLGTLGLRLARWLVERQGVRFLVLLGRRGPESAARDAVDALRARGAVVDLMTADVALEADVVRVLDEIRRRLPPLKGVVHCAGVLEDGILGQLDWPRFTRATAPKVRGGWLLHRFTTELELDCFLLPSTLLSLTGGAGQANYAAANAFLDALGAHRRALGLPAMVVNWGPWADAGMATVAGSRGEAMWRARGTRLIPPDDAMRVFAHLVDQGIEQAAVTITDWGAYLERFPEPPAVYTALLRQGETRRAPDSARAGADVGARLRAAPPAEHRRTLLDFVRAEVTEELGFTEEIDTRQPLDELGVDSLMSVNVANRLERALRIAVPLGKLVRGPSLEELVDDLYPDLAAAGVVPHDTGAVRAPAVHARQPAGAGPAGNDWLVFPRPNAAARVRLFCFHYAGGGAAVFRPWAELLDPAVELVAIEPPGRGGRIDEPALDRLDVFLERLLPAMAPYLDRPCVFFGHCLGALLLYETARRLLAERRVDLAHVFVSGARPPHRVASEGRFEETLLADLLEHPAFDPLRSGHEQPDEVFAAMIRHFNIGATEAILGNADLRRLLLPTIRADFALALHYRFRPEPPWDVPLTCFVGRDDPYVSGQDALAWGKYSRIAFHLWLREGAHFLVADDRAFIVDAINRTLGGRAAVISGGRDG